MGSRQSGTTPSNTCAEVVMKSDSEAVKCHRTPKTGTFTVP